MRYAESLSAGADKGFTQMGSRRKTRPPFATCQQRGIQCISFGSLSKEVPLISRVSVFLWKQKNNGFADVERSYVWEVFLLFSSLILLKLVQVLS